MYILGYNKKDIRVKMFMKKINRPKIKLFLVLENIRSLFNVGALFRTADGVEVSEILLVGYSGVKYYLDSQKIQLHPHLHKTDMGTTKFVPWQHFDDIQTAINYLKKKESKTEIVSLEQSPSSQSLFSYRPTGDTALILGNEIMGVSTKALKLSDVVLEIPQWGRHNSLNVAVAGSIALYQLIANSIKSG